MKPVKTLILLVFAFTGGILPLIAQTVGSGYEQMYAIGSTGGCDTLFIAHQKPIECSWTIGEIAVATQDNANYRVSEGFHQSWPDLFEIPADSETPDLSFVITPNGDGLNEAFIPVDDILARYPLNELFVVNRWGVVVYQAEPYDNSWMGTNFQGQQLPEGTYYYLLRLRNDFNTTLKGSITIRR